MQPREARLFNPPGPDRVAVLTLRPAEGGSLALRLTRGPNRKKLRETLAVALPEAQAIAQFDVTLTALKAEGFLPAGVPALLKQLASPDPRERALAALRLGWRRERNTVPALLTALNGAVDEACSLIDALGMIGDPRAVPAVQPYAARKLLSRRRSAVEALFQLLDAPTADPLRQNARSQLPPPVQAVLAANDESQPTPAAVAALTQALHAVDAMHRGLALDNLYEVGTPLAVAAVRQLLPTLPFERAYIWRYVKSIFKRATLRHDLPTFGLLAHAIEAKGRRSAGTKATVKSGLDGSQREVLVFGTGTQNFLRRFSWRYLHRLARYRPDEYPFAAAEAIIHYGPEDASEPHGRFGEFADCYVLQRVLFGASKRLSVHGRHLRFRFKSSKQTQPPANVREEKFPELWDAQPQAYLRLLGAAKLPLVHAFALKAIEARHRDVLRAAPIEEITPLLDAPYEPTVKLGLSELLRRFDPHNPDWPLLLRILRGGEAARNLAHGWLRQTAERWTADAELTLRLLAEPDAQTRTLVADLVTQWPPQSPAVRLTLAARLLALLRSPEPEEGAHDAAAQVASAVLLDEFGPLLTVADLIALATHGSPAAQSVAGALLARRPEAIEELGMERISALARHAVGAVRAAAHAFIRAAADRLQDDPSLLFILVESEWPDTRRVAFELLQTVPFDRLGIEGIGGLLDSTRADVQDLGIQLARKHLAELPVVELIERLVQHPDPRMRPFTLELVFDHLPDDPATLQQLGSFFRSALFDLWPSRAVKRRALAILADRGLHDAEQAKVAAKLLGEVARVQGRADFEAALEALVRIRMKFPEVESAVALAGGEG